MSTTKLSKRTAKKHLPSHIDVFICSASFEDRCKSVALLLNPTDIKNTIITVNNPLAPKVEDKLNFLKSRFSHGMVEVFLDRNEPIRSSDAFIKALSSVSSNHSLTYLLDITTFTHESVSIILRILQLFTCADDKIFLIYNGAKEYSIGDDDTAKWLSRGLREIRSVLGFPGEFHPSKKIHLIALIGFEPERVARVIDKYEPSKISLGYATKASSITEGNHITNKFFHEKVSASFPNRQEFHFSGNDASETMEAIESQIHDSDSYNIVIAPMNTKISTVGAALAAMRNDSIQICYAQPEVYNYANYSSADNSFYLIQVDASFRSFQHIAGETI